MCTLQYIFWDIVVAEFSHISILIAMLLFLQ